MKNKLTFLFPLLFTLLILFTTSCASVKITSRDEGQHKGWYKNPSNPHHPLSTKKIGKDLEKGAKEIEKEAKKVTIKKR